MENTYPGNTPQPANDDEIAPKRIMFLFIRKWYWFVAGVVFALAAAFLFNSYYRQQAYTIDTSILINGVDKDFYLAGLIERPVTMPERSSVIENEIGLLRSSVLAHHVLEKLNWRVSWYKKEFFKRKDLYPDEPFIVHENAGGGNLEGLMLCLRPGTDGTYTLSAGGTVLVNYLPQYVKFEAEGKFGEPFSNAWFHFTLHLEEGAVPDPDDEFFFRFNNINTLTQKYIARQQIEPAGKTGDVIRLSVSGNEPLREIHYLNGLVNEYINRDLEFRTETRKRSLEFINKQLSGMSDSLNAAGNRVTLFRSQNRLPGISAGGALIMEQLKEIEEERLQSRMQLGYFRNLLTCLENSGDIKNMLMPSAVGIEDPFFNAVVLKLCDLCSKRDILTWNARAGKPVLLSLNNEINRVAGYLRKNLIKQISDTGLKIQSLQCRETTISRQLSNLPVQERQLIAVTRRYELTRKIYTNLLKKQAEAGIALASAVPGVRVVDPALVDRIEKTGASSHFLYLLAFTAGLVLPGLALLGLSYRKGLPTQILTQSA